MIAFLKDLLIPDSFTWEEILMALLMWITVGVLLVVSVFLLTMLIKFVAYKTEYGSPRDFQGKVVSLVYHPSYTTLVYNPALKISQPQVHPARHEVVIDADGLEKFVRVDNQEIYSSVESGEKVVVKTQPIYIKLRVFGSKWEYDGERILSISNAKYIFGISTEKEATQTGR